MAVTAWGKCHVTGTWNNHAGVMKAGTYSVYIPVRVTDAADNVIVPRGVQEVGTLSTSPGAPSLDLMVLSNTDPDTFPHDGSWKPEITVKFDDGSDTERYVIDTPVDGEVNLRTVILVQTFPAQTASLVRGVPGGVAALNDDGDVVDAEGNLVIAGGGVESWAEIEALPDTPDLVTTDDLTPLATTAALTAGLATKADDAATTAVLADKADAAATAAALATKADLVGGVIPTAQIPPLAINETFVVASQAAMLALTAQRGDMAVRSDNGRTYVLATDSPSTLADWKEVLAAGQVQSVAGKTGVVSLANADVGLGNVDNTADTAKPVSTAQAAAIALKANAASPTFTGTATAPSGFLEQLHINGLVSALAAKVDDSQLTTSPYKYTSFVHVLEAGQDETDLPVDFPAGPTSIVLRKKTV